jgi:hypothetical protein
MAPQFRDNIKVRYVSMKLRFVVNRIWDFLKQLHANVAQQLFAIVEDPTAPRISAGAKTLLHPRCTSAQKPRFGFRSRVGFSTESIAQVGQGTGIT